MPTMLPDFGSATSNNVRSNGTGLEHRFTRASIYNRSIFKPNNCLSLNRHFMRILQIVLHVSVAASLLSCKDSRNRVNNPVVHAAEQNHNVYSSFKRYSADMVDQVFKNIIDSSESLKELQERLDGLGSEKADSLKSFDAYDQTSKDYYASARTHVLSVKDSVLRRRLAGLVDQSELDYEGHIGAHKQLLATINAKLAHIRDMNTQLKIMLTIPEIQKYQRDNLPSKNALEGLSRQLDQLTARLDSITKKKGG